MRALRLAALLALVALCSAAHGDDDMTEATVRPSAVYFTGPPAAGGAGVAPNVAVQGDMLVSLMLSSLQACLAECDKYNHRCSYVHFCHLKEGCSDGRGHGMLHGECHLLAASCSMEARGVPATIISAFPLRHFPPAVLGSIPYEPARGITGADFECPTSEVPGMCAFTNLVHAVLLCPTLGETCRAMVALGNGTDGCSLDPTYVLKNEVLTPANTFISADTYTLILTGQQSTAHNLFLYAGEGRVVLPSKAEVAALEAGGADAPHYKGCILAEQAIFQGDVLEVLDGMQSAEECCRECAARMAAGAPPGPAGAANAAPGNATAPRQLACNVFNFCGAKEGCQFDDPSESQRHVDLGKGQCQLRYQQVAAESFGGPPFVLERGPEVAQGFTAGAPLTVWGPQLEGYQRLPGLAVFLHGLYPCDGSVRPQTGECGRQGSPQELAGQCSGDAECAAFVLRHGAEDTLAAGAAGAGDAQQDLGFFRNDSAAEYRALVPSAVLYVRQGSGSGSGSGLSAGAIAGIAVGAAAAAAALAVAAWVVVRRQRRRAPRLQEAPKGMEAAAELGDIAVVGSKCSSVQHTSDGKAPSASPSSRLGSAPSSAPGSRGAAPVTELAALIAAQEAAEQAERPGSDGSSAGGRHSLSAPAMLPEHLRGWVVEPGEVSYLKRPDGRLWEVGAGACAKVYKVMYRGEVAAAKEVELAGGGAGQQEVFLTEAQRLHALRHQHIISFYGVSFVGGKGVLLMEYAEGRDLQAALQLLERGSGERLFGWWRRGRKVALEVAKAVNYLHNQSIVHMDIKAANVLLTAGAVAKLSDVGLSRLQKHSFLTHTGAITGTFSWIAPEVLMGSKQGKGLTAAVDVYSFGVLLWEIMTGELPQRGSMREPRVPDECPQEAADLMWDCLKEDPAARPSARQVMERLAALQAPSRFGLATPNASVLLPPGTPTSSS
ncbi:Serine threonine-kinase CTR1 [Micractinium conductrix]|uniref:Serine threonine-kinase CTR1 n=1 Tax=Micractinium conductrix TaxID=554055 RepID=A0A2P6V104_9CHLO|nr:Serine threonine-kinase CTR1 [Micractinium conductrix]|eukprot:PSC67771.1 Serine threonine-kinase CTR1 [Micractinium conductrix]